MQGTIAAAHGADDYLRVTFLDSSATLAIRCLTTDELHFYILQRLHNLTPLKFWKQSNTDTDLCKVKFFKK